MVLKIFKYIKRQGRNNTGKITVRHRGGGKKYLVRSLETNRNLEGILGKVCKIMYYPYKKCFICLIYYTNGLKKYILKPSGLKLGDFIFYSKKLTKFTPGNCTLLNQIPLKQKIHNISRNFRQKAMFVRSPGSFAEILGKTKNFVIVKMPSGINKTFNREAKATIGFIEQVKQLDNKNKAGYSRIQGIRPTVRGSAMNACDHPHGGGEGKTPIGRKFPLTPWGKLARGGKKK